MMKLIDETDLRPAQCGSRRIAERRRRGRSEIDLAVIGLFQQTGDMQQRGLTGAGRRDERHGLTRVEREIDTAENLKRGAGLRVGPDDPLERQGWDTHP